MTVDLREYYTRVSAGSDECAALVSSEIIREEKMTKDDRICANVFC